jgi:hypothetical protein
VNSFPPGSVDPRETPHLVLKAGGLEGITKKIIRMIAFIYYKTGQ